MTHSQGEWSWSFIIWFWKIWKLSHTAFCHVYTALCCLAKVWTIYYLLPGQCLFEQSMIIYLIKICQIILWSLFWSRYVRSVSPCVLRCYTRIGSGTHPVHALHGQFGKIIKSFALLHHCYADNTQVYSFCRSDERLLLIIRLIDYIEAIARWIASNQLRLNPAKSEFMWTATWRWLHHIDDFIFDLLDGAVVTWTSVRNLGAYLDQAITLHEHIARLVSACFYQLRRIRSIHRSIPTSTAIQLVNIFIISQVDYCNSVLSEAPACLTDRVQSVLNAAARLICGRWWYDHMTDLIRDRLHWLPVSHRIRFKWGLFAYKGLHDAVPSYIADYCVMKDTTQNSYSLPTTSASTRDNLIVPDTKTQFRQCSFAVAGPKVWNSLLNIVKNAVCWNCQEQAQDASF